MAEVRGIDPRGPRFAASVTSVLLLVATFLALVGISTARASDWYIGFADGSPAAWFGWFGGQAVSGDFAFVAGAFALPIAPPLARILDPGFIAVLVVALLFLWSVVAPRTAPWGVLYRTLIQPRLAPPTDLEDPRPPRFAQGVGLFVTGVGLVLHLVGVPYALPVAAGMAFIAAFLNAVFGLCLGCQLWLLLQRGGLVGRTA
jgi:hypothetical protein